MNFRDSFRFAPELIHLNNGGIAPLSWVARTKMLELATEVAQRGAHFVPFLNQQFTFARQTYADFLGTTAPRAAFTANLATSVSMVAWGLPFHEGDGILSLDQEYPSNAYIWHTLAREKKLRLDIFESNTDTTVNWDAFIERIKPGIRAVVLSWVQFRTGVTAPLSQIQAACQKHRAWLIVDGIQGLGAMPFDFKSTGADIVCGGSHKWLYGMMGHGFLAFQDDLFLEMKPIIQGAMTFGTPDDAVDPRRLPQPRATRFEPGAPDYLSTLSSAESLREIQRCGVENIHRHALGLTQVLTQGLKEMGLAVLGEPLEQKQSPIVTFKSEPHLQRIHEKLNLQHISHAYRNQTIRLSPHGFNTRDEIDLTLQSIRAVL